MGIPPSLLPLEGHNLELQRHTHPADWRNPPPAPRYNLVVIGAGTAGLVTAAGAAALGARVALVERELLGGDCLNVGCVPSKALIRAARAAADVRSAARFGVQPGTGAVDFRAVMERMRRVRAEIAPHDSAARFAGLGVDVFFGQAQFSGPRAVAVGEHELRFCRAVIAAGARAARPTVPGLAETGYLTNETVFSLQELPRRLAVLGGGPIGCELAQALARFGAEVTLLQRGPSLLPREDRRAGEIVQRAVERDGVGVVCGAEVRRAWQQAGDTLLEVQVAGEARVLAVDAVLLGVGRTPNVEGLGLERAGVAYDPRGGVQVDDRLRTTNRRIFAAGDICSKFQFTHAADAMARIVIQNALFGGRARASALTIPWCTYTDPEVARVGRSAADARAEGVPCEVIEQPLSGVDRARLDGEEEGFVQVVLARGRDRILGATIVARHAGEMISEVTLAMANGLGLRAIGRTIHPYPTQAEAIKRVADAWNRRRLTPRLRRWAERWFAWQR
jgi:pyruvate/2-oxoglutarate dehydrogenase complex dihydrolipoamide dehydrogenase (E3) component